MDSYLDVPMKIKCRYMIFFRENDKQIAMPTGFSAKITY